MNKIFVINLDDRIHRWNRFKNLDDRMIRFPAIDSRKNNLICEKYGLNLDPVGLTNQLYFTESKGAVGCYVSHYLIWRKMVEENISSALILEDDAEFKDVESFINKNIYVNQKKYSLIQINKRNPDKKIIENYFNGTESYILTKSGAEKLLSITRDSSILHGIFHASPMKYSRDSSGKSIRPERFSVYKNEKPQDFKKYNSIIAPVDKVIGYCSVKKLLPTYRLNVLIDPHIGLHDQIETSDVESNTGVPFWKKNNTQIQKIMNSKKFKWWEK